MNDDAEPRADLEADLASTPPRPAADAPSSDTPAQDEDDRPASLGPGALAPTRPWNRRRNTPVRQADPPGPSPTGLQPVRAWNGHKPAGESEADKPPAPSNPSVVLERLAAEPEHARTARRRWSGPRHAAASNGEANGVAEPAEGPPPARRALRWLLARSPQSEPGADAQFRLPEPDPSFQRPGLRPSPGPGPTRDWSRSPAAAAPAREEPARHRPSPGPQATKRPSPASAGTPGSPGSPGSSGSEAAPHPRPAPAAEYRPPDVTRFLDAAAPKADDAGTEKDAGGKRAGTGLGARGRRLLVRTLVVAVIAAIAAFLLRTFVVQPYYIPSESMEPTLHGCSGCTDDHVLVDKISYRRGSPHVDDVVVFHKPKNANTSEQVLIKRVIALPTDTVQLRNGRVYVNGNLVDEPYVNKKCGARPTRPLTSTAKWRIPDNDVFVMGDNRCDSYDSRAFGPIPESSIIGRAFFIIWPLNRMGTI